MDPESANVERVTTGRHPVPAGTNAFRVIDNPSTPPKHEHGTWVSPSVVMRKRLKEDVPRIVQETSPKRIRSSAVADDVHGNWVQTKKDDEPIPARSSSQCTYTVRKSIFQEERPPVRKVSVLEDFDPHRKTDGVKRIVHADGRVVKVCTLDDFSGMAKSEVSDKRTDLEETNKRNVLKKMVLTDVSISPKKSKTKKNTEERESADAKKEEDQNNKENKPDKIQDDQMDNADGNVVTELKKILDEDCAKRKTLTDKKREAKTDENKQARVERKRNVDLEAVQKYIKMQKMKRMEQTKLERKKKAVEEEARKKKLEELRVRTMQLAATSKKKEATQVRRPISTIKIVEPEAETEEDVTMSLGLKQTKPKVSYNESISNLKKKPAKTQPKQITMPSQSNQNPVTPPNLSPPCLSAKLETPKSDLETDANETLRKLAETLQMSMEQRRKQSSISLGKTFRDVSTGESNPNIVTVDLETIQSLKQDIKRISENFQVLHGIITHKSDAIQSEPERAVHPRMRKPEIPDPFPTWLQNVGPRPHPYNVLTAVRSKIKLTDPCSDSSEPVATRRSEPVTDSEKAMTESDTDSLMISTDKYSSYKTGPISPTDTKSTKSSTEDNYYSMKEDSVSELSSSILDSDKDKIFSKESLVKPRDCLVTNAVKDSPQSSIAEEVTSMSLDTGSVSAKKVCGESLELVSPDVQLSVHTNVRSDVERDKTVSAVSDNGNQQSRSEAVITELDELITDSDKTSTKVESVVARANEEMPRSAFNPEVLHMQFQAELSLLETFQRSLSHFLDMEKMKALSQKSDKAVNTDFCSEEIPSVIEDNTESIKTELDKTQEDASESIKTEQKSLPSSSKWKTSDLSDCAMGISFQMLNRMMKDEELRSEHQLALIRLREKTLNENVKAELTLLEMRKKALKERGTNEESSISAIKKKQRGILLKYQHEKEDIERLKKMHKIASEERKIMIKQQKQIRKMQLTTKDMLIKLKKREKSPQKRSPVKAKGSKIHDSQSDIPEEILMSENTFTETITSVEESIEHSIDDDLDITSRSNVSEGDDEILRRNMRTLEEKISKSIDKLTVPKKQLMPVERKHLKRGMSVDDLLKWTRRLEEKENWLKQMEKDAENLGAKHCSFRDRSTSPFQIQEMGSSSITEMIETKKSSSSLVESKMEIEDSDVKSSVPEKIATSASEDIPEEFSKKTSGRLEYNSESFESSSDTHKSKIAVKSNEGNANGVTIKMALSPRVHSARRQYSSGSDDSINLFHTETASEQSDVEIRVAALHEQLRRRKLEAERLRREQRKAHRERLKAKEQSLLKQIEAYDMYIQKKKMELEREYEKSVAVRSKPVEKISRSESEIVESIKEENETGSEIVTKIKDGSATSSMLESLPKQTDGSQSESDEQTISNASVRTTLQSPEKADIESEVIERSEDYSDTFESEEKGEVEKTLSAEECESEAEVVEEDDGETIPEVEEDAEDNDRIVSFITESVLNDLMNESVDVFRRKNERSAEIKTEDVEDGLELLTGMLVADLASEAVDDVLQIFNKRKLRIVDVRRRVYEIMSQTPGTRREQRRPQDMMVTTYDVTDEEELNSPEREEFLQSLSPKQNKPSKIEVNILESTPQQSALDSYGQEWFDDDFGLSRSRREAEELRVQQLQIEQEIQQLQAQQEQVLYYYLRQIPNKPPPPYTPPGTATAEKLTSEGEITAVMSTAVRYLTEEMNSGKDVVDVQPPGVFFNANDSEHVKCYKVFLFDLAKHIISELIGIEFREAKLPWMRTNEKISKFKIKKVERSYDCLYELVMKQVLVLFGFRQKMGKERLIVRWSRRKRDHVDELLVGESQEEEAEWTHYDEDEVTVKNNVTIGILDSLLDETAQLLNAIWTKKMKVGS